MTPIDTRLELERHGRKISDNEQQIKELEKRVEYLERIIQTSSTPNY